MKAIDVFDLMTAHLDEQLLGYEFKEIRMPDMSLQRWWTGNGESVWIVYKDDRHNELAPRGGGVVSGDVTKEELVELLADMVHQNLYQDDGVYETGFIGLHKEVLMLLCELGIMEMVQDGYGRGFWAKFKPSKRGEG